MPQTSTSHLRVFIHGTSPGTTRNFSLWNGRSNSSSQTAPKELPPSREVTEFSPEPTSAVTSDSINLIAEPIVSNSTGTIINDSAATLQYGDLAVANLVDWSPTGIVCWTFQLINVGIGLPWFWTIITGTVFWELLCFPAAIYSLKNVARLRAHRTNITALRTALKHAEIAKNTVEQKKLAIGLEEYYKKHNIKEVHPFMNLGNVSSLVSLCVLLAVGDLCHIDPLMHSGFSLIPDLTIKDSGYVLPVLLAGIVDSNIRHLIRVGPKPDSFRIHGLNVLRLVGLPLIWGASKIQLGLCLAIITITALSRAQILILGNPAFRRYFGLPIQMKQSNRIPEMSTSLKVVIANWKARRGSKQ